MDQVGMNNILILAMAGTTFVKLLVDGFKLAVPLCRPAWPVLLAFLTGPIILVLLILAAGMVLTAQAGAQAVLAGLLAAGGAIGVTELHKKAREDQP